MWQLIYAVDSYISAGGWGGVNMECVINNVIRAVGGDDRLKQTWGQIQRKYQNLIDSLF